LKKTSNVSITSKDSLIIADIQNDFLPNGALAVKEGDMVISALNEYAKIFQRANANVIASRDWHPPNHISFKAQGGIWPPHCVQGTKGAEFSTLLKLPEEAIIVSKATDPTKEAYSVFDGTGLAEKVKTMGVDRVFVGGLATDYCVVNTVLDARKLGLDAVVLLDATKGIDVQPGDVDRALEMMLKVGASQVTLADFPESEVFGGEESVVEVIGDKPLSKAETKKVARMRPKGSYKRLRREHR
jgi:nicotinamidase/pyrazinamidase